MGKAHMHGTTAYFPLQMISREELVYTPLRAFAHRQISSALHRPCGEQACQEGPSQNKVASCLLRRVLERHPCGVKFPHDSVKQTSVPSSCSRHASLPLQSGAYQKGGAGEGKGKAGRKGRMSEKAEDELLLKVCAFLKPLISFMCTLDRALFAFLVNSGQGSVWESDAQKWSRRSREGDVGKWERRIGCEGEGERVRE